MPISRTVINLAIRDSYFRILVEVYTDHTWTRVSRIMQSEQSTRLWSLNLQLSTKLFGSVILAKTLYSMISNIIHFFVEQKFWKRFFREPKINCKGETTIQTFVDCLIYSSARKTFCKIIYHKETISMN